MTGTLAVLISVAFVIGSGEFLPLFSVYKQTWKTRLISGITGGVFGIYGNLAGADINGAIVSIRDIGPMLAGYLGGPIGGLIAGLIAGAHRLLLGGITAQACIVATCLIGLICGLLAMFFGDRVVRPVRAYALGMVLETMHLGIVLIMVKPFSTAWGIVEQIAIPFIVINGVGIGVMIWIIQIINKRRNLEVERNRMKSELSVASHIQLSMLPVVTERSPGRDDIKLATSIEPAKEVGGDFYDFFFVDKTHMVLVIADVSGKGIPAALFMVKAKQTIQNSIRKTHSIAEAMTDANDELCSNNEAEMFVTAWVGVLDLETWTIRYVCAGHNPPMLTSTDGSTFIKGKGLVLAAMEDFVYKENELTLEKGDRLFLYTDGVTEAENVDHDLYGEERLQSCLDDSKDLNVDATIEAVKESMSKHVGKADQFDDITMMCVQRIGD